MAKPKYYKSLVKGLRKLRVIHRYLGITLAIFLLISATTGVLLALKKEVAWIQPPTGKGTETDIRKWKSLEELSTLASQTLYQTHPAQNNNPIDRMDVRPSKGIVKVLFKNDYWEVQLDGASGEIISIATRQSDWLESIHDGSIISDLFKLVSMNFLGIGLVFLAGSGLWLWYSPKTITWIKKKIQKTDHKRVNFVIV